MKYLLGALFLVVSGAGFLFWRADNVSEFALFSASTTPAEVQPAGNPKNSEIKPGADIEPQKPLVNPPAKIKAVYATSWVAGTPSMFERLVNIAKTTEINAIVIDVKDYSGYVAYDIKNDAAERYKAKEIRIPKINSLIKRLHDGNIYVIARISVFQDPRLAAARPDLAVKSKKNGKTWRDKKNLSWVDAASEEAWEYNIAVAKDAAGRGFDEINFDYIRFPSDGNLNDADFPFWNEKSPRRETLQKFFRRLNEELSGIPISADLFGLTTTGADDLGIGQVLEDAFGNFDYVAPMVYPSHFANGTFGFKNPAAHPYEVVKNSMESASKRLDAFYNATTTRAEINNSNSAVRFSKLRPWLQDFDLGADYDAKMVKAQIEASAEAKSAGWMLWDPKNVYTKEALISE